MNLPNRIFFTGVPGSRWSGIAQILEMMPGMNTSDRIPEREYDHHSYTGHKGAYFGSGMEFLPLLDSEYLDSAWTDPDGCKLIKSHEWSYYLGNIKHKFPNDWIMLVYRPDMSSYAWWHEAGGFQIKYPNYDFYVDSPTMLSKIIKQNSLILKYGYEQNCKWEYFTESWIYDNFKHKVKIDTDYDDILISLII